MDALLNTALAPPRFLTPCKLPLRPPHQAGCSRKNDNDTSLYLEPSWLKLDDHIDEQDLFTSTENSGKAPHNNDIWKLFHDAQRNILYLNKQRLMAMEELNKCQQENQKLHAKLEELDAIVKKNGVKGSISQLNTPSITSELLLRIDAMVLSDLIGTGEASDLRRLITGGKIGHSGILGDIQKKNNSALLKELRQFSGDNKRQGLHIVHICTEMAPVTSDGSLASYITGISQALQRKGNSVEVILPKYATLFLKEVWGLRKVEAEVGSYFGGNWHGNSIWTGVVNGIATTFIEPLYHSSFFNRSRMNGFSDDFERFAYFSRAALDYLIKTAKQPDVLHIHNWETSIVGPLFWDIFVHKGLGACRVLLTCHGLKHQWLEKPEKLALCGLDPAQLNRPDRLQDNIKTHLVNILKGGVVYSNKVLLVSSTYSKERLIHNLSYGLESILAIHKDKLLIAPYGFDDSNWDPSNDKFLPANYSNEDMKGKVVCKNILRQRLKFSGIASTVVGCIFSDASETDLENLKVAIWPALRKGAEVILLGHSTKGADAAEQVFEDLKDQKMRFLKKYDEALLRLVFAGSDIILCLSYQDPLHQVLLKAIKYGGAPLAITMYSNEFRYTEKQRYGSTNLSKFLFSNYENMSLVQALDQIKKNPSRWSQMIKDGMSMDFSWSAECYDIHMEAYMSVKNL